MLQTSRVIHCITFCHFVSVGLLLYILVRPFICLFVSVCASHKFSPSFLLCYRHPEYYKLIEEPIDLKDIESYILTGHYTAVEPFDADFTRLFNNVEVSACKRFHIP